MTKVIVTQYGSRHRYLIPQILYKNDMLEYLYTDSCKGSALEKMARFFIEIGLRAASFNRLVRRTPKLPPNKIKANDFLQIKLLWLRITKQEKFNSIYTIFEGNASTYKRWGCGNADWLYAMHIETFEFTKFAKRKGLKVLADIYEDPYIFKELADEVQEVEELKCIRYLKDRFIAEHKLRMRYINQLLKTADQYLIPSEYVTQSLRRHSASFDEKKVNIIPYISSMISEVHDNKPIKGRIIWIGNDPVRKGLVYALRAVNELKKKYPYIDLRVIGPMPKEIIESSYFTNLNFVGYCNKEQLKEEFRQADMYVFPTLAEGFAGSLLEAASFGVPIITTHASGFGDDFPGIFVNRKNSEDLVNAVTLLLEDRQKRDSISQKIFSYSHKYDEKSFEEKLIELLTTK